jgi:hypothetical protein
MPCAVYQLAPGSISSFHEHDALAGKKAHFWSCLLNKHPDIYAFLVDAMHALILISELTGKKKPQVAMEIWALVIFA